MMTVSKTRGMPEIGTKCTKRECGAETKHIDKKASHKTAPRRALAHMRYRSRLLLGWLSFLVFFQDANASHRSENDGCEPRDRDLSSLVADESARLMGEEPMVGQVN